MQFVPRGFVEGTELEGSVDCISQWSLVADTLVGSNAGTGGLEPKPRFSLASLVKWGSLPRWGLRGWSQRPEKAWLLLCMVVVTAPASVGPDSEGWSHSPEGTQLLLGMTVVAALSRGGIRI